MRELLCLGLVGCYLLTGEDVREHDAGLVGPPPTDGDADVDADTDADADPTGDTGRPADGDDTIESATPFAEALGVGAACLPETALDPGGRR